jgi:hypothetical protein
MDPYAQQQPPTYGAAPASVNFAPYQPTPASSLGFASPSPNPFASPPAPAYGQDSALFAAPEAAPDTQQFTMNAEPPSPPQANGSLADQAYQKFANMDNFDLVSKKDEQRANPFESSTIGAQPSLADMQASTNKVREQT